MCILLKLGEEAAEVMHVDDDASLVDDVQELVREIVESELTEHAIQSSDVEDCQSRSPAGIRGST